MHAVRAPRLRILFLAADVRLCEQDGQAIHTLGMCKALSELGNEVLLLVGDARSPSPLPASIKCETIRNLGTGAIRDVVAWGRVWNPDVIYERRSTPKLGARASRRLHIPYFLEINGLPELEAETVAPLPRIRRMWRKRAFKQCTRIFVPSAKLGQVVSESRGISPDRISVVPNGVDLAEFKPIDKMVARSALGWNADVEAVVFVGKLVPWQGLDCLVLATKELSKSRNVRVFIIGAGPLFETLAGEIRSEGVQKTIELVGSVPHTEIPTWIAASDLCVAPFSRSRNQLIELSPLKLFEYMAMGRPIVAADVPGIRALVGKAAILVQPDSTTALARAIDEALSSPRRLQSLGEEGLTLAQKCSWQERANCVMLHLQTDGVHTRGTVQ